MAGTTELDALTVHGDTPVGWCACTRANEIVDIDGRRLGPDERKPGVIDPRSPSRRVYDDPEVIALRDHLRQHNGMRGLEICDPSEIERAARIFRRDVRESGRLAPASCIPWRASAWRQRKP